MDISFNKNFKSLSTEICEKVYNGVCIPTVEEECKQKLIEPILEELGYDIRGRDVYYEHGGTSRVDLWINVLACLEAKKLFSESNGYIYDYVLGDPEHKKQLYTYLIRHKWPFGILSNGIEWQLYRKEDYVTSNSWTPFRTINIRYIKDDEIELFSDLRKGIFDINNFNDFYKKYSIL